MDHAAVGLHFVPALGRQGSQVGMLASCKKSTPPERCWWSTEVLVPVYSSRVQTFFHIYPGGEPQCHASGERSTGGLFQCPHHLHQADWGRRERDGLENSWVLGDSEDDADKKQRALLHQVCKEILLVFRTESHFVVTHINI